MGKMMNIKGWYDAFGELYMLLLGSSSQASHTGQFFTPHNICDLLQTITDVQDTKKDKLVGEPVCGSCRTLLAFQAQHLVGKHSIISDKLQLDMPQYFRDTGCYGVP